MRQQRCQLQPSTSSAAVQQQRVAPRPFSASVPRRGSQSGARPHARGAGAGSGAEVRLIATDVDGTLLNSQQQLPERTARAVNAAVDAGVPVILATGKARGPWLADVQARLQLVGPSIFLQGLLIFDEAGELIYSRSLEEGIAEQVVEFAAAEGLTVTVYSNDSIICETTDEHTDRLLWYREPPPCAVGPLKRQLGQVPFHKMILMGEHERLVALRPRVEALFGRSASLTTALPGMLEVLPLGASKGAAVNLVLRRLGVPPAALMAAGDGENDVEMLALAGLGVAMGNAGDKVKAAADAVTGTNDECGLAQAIEQYVLAPRGGALSAAA